MREQRLVESINYIRPQYRQSLHHIALRFVFEFVFPPDGFLNPLLTLGPDSPWSRALRMRKALILVCKQWYAVALPFLYDNVAIRRVGQIAALKRTLDDVPGRGSTIRSMTLLCHVPKNMVSFVASALSDVLSSCTSLTSLSLGPMFSSSIDGPHCAQSELDIGRTIGFKTQLARVHTLKYNWSFWDGPHVPSLIFTKKACRSAYNNIVCLEIFMHATNHICLDVHLDSLKVLTLVTVEGAQENEDGDLESFCSWNMPGLEEVRFRPYIAPGCVPRHFVRFLKQQEHLRILDTGCRGLIPFGYDEMSLYPKLQEVLEARPSIRRLVIPAWSKDTSICDNCDRPLLDIDLDHVDLWVSGADLVLRKALFTQRRNWKFVRFLDNRLSTIPDLPYLLPPWCTSPCCDPPKLLGAKVHHDIFGMHVSEGEITIGRRNRYWNGEGSLYVPDINDLRFEKDLEGRVHYSDLLMDESILGNLPGEDIDTDVEEDTSDEGSSEDDHVQEQLTAKEVLEIFSDLLDE